MILLAGFRRRGDRKTKVLHVAEVLAGEARIERREENVPKAR